MALLRLRRAGTRAAAVLGAAALGAGAFAAPAAAAPEPIETFLGFEGPFHAEEDPRLQGFEAYFGDDFTPGAHTLTLTLAIDIADDAFRFSGGDIGKRCEVNAGHTEVVCVQEASAYPGFRFEFDVAVPDAAHVGTHPYTVDLAVDGEVVHSEAKHVEIAPPGSDDPLSPYRYGDVELDGVEPGSTVAVQPEFLQEDPIAEDAAAVMATFDHSRYYGAGALDDYDNCIADDYDLTCFVTDFPDDPGAVFTPAAPVEYEVSPNAPGPADICACAYRLQVIDAETLAILTDGLSWDPDSDELFALREVLEPESEFGDLTRGRIAIETVANPFDLAVDDANAKGRNGDEVTLTVPVGNEGPADAYSFYDASGSFALAVTLPKGLELMTIATDEASPWSCSVSDGVSYPYPELGLGQLDFVCFFVALPAGEELDLSFTVKITDADSDDKGTMQVLALERDGYPGVADADAKNDKAEITVNGNGSGQLPTTGVSLGMIIGAAVLVLVAGVVMFALTSRRRKADAGE